MANYVRDYSRPNGPGYETMPYLLTTDFSPEGSSWVQSQGGNVQYYDVNDQPINYTPTSTGSPAKVAPTEYGNPELKSYMEQQATNPGLPPGTEFNYTPIEENANEFLDDSNQLQGTYGQDATKGTTSTVDQSQVPEVTAAQYDPAQAEAVTGEVTDNMTVRGQLKNLYSDFGPNGEMPAWAAGAARVANEAMNARGLGASSIAGMSIVQAIQESALPIAQFDANIFSQQAFLNQRNKQEAMLSNQAATNAAAQFNTKNAQDVEQFMATMASQIMQFNSTQKNAMEQFNVGQDNSMKQFYDKMNDAREQFNSTMSFAVAKSNAEWRRQINTANTAGVNAENQLNVENRFNMSQQAIANLWQEARDTFQWAQVSAENDKDRAFQLARYQLARSDALGDRNHAENYQFAQSLGALGSKLVTGSVGDALAKGISGLFSGGADPASTSTGQAYANDSTYGYF